MCHFKGVGGTCLSIHNFWRHFNSEKTISLFFSSGGKNKDPKGSIFIKIASQPHPLVPKVYRLAQYIFSLLLLVSR